MADIRNIVLSKFGVDIVQENVFKLYKIDSITISSQELEIKFQNTRKRWNSSINGANEKNAERDKARLEKADKYEAILKDAKLREELFAFYSKQHESTGEGAVPVASTQFAKEYFELIATTKKIKKADVDFFFKYYQEERKNKKAILEMLSKELKVNGLGKEEKYAEEGDIEESEGKKKDDSSPLIVNLFQEATVLKIRRAIDKFDEASKSVEICQRYPSIQFGLYEFLEIKDVDSAKQFTEIMASKGKEVYAIRQERGTEYIPLVDMFNIFQSVGDYRDVVDNILEFKLLLKYPNLTPYMYSFVDMKPSTMKGIIDVADREYVFRDDTDFILNYYKPVHDNFGISDNGIGAILRKAEKKAKQNKVLNEIDEKLGRQKHKRKVSIGAEIIHWLAYLPVFAVYFVFEVARVIFSKLHRMAIPVFLVLFGLENLLLPKYGIDNLIVLKKLFFKNQWLSYLSNIMGETGVNVVGTILLSLVLIIILLAIYIIPPLFVALFIFEFSDEFNKRFDWGGIRRTFQLIFQNLGKRTENQYIDNKKRFIWTYIGKVIVNISCLFILIFSVKFASVGFRLFSEITGYFHHDQIKNEIDISEYDNSVIKIEDSSELQIGETMIITVSSANIRSGPGISYEIVANAKKGDLFIATGNQETASNGRTWYEIYLDEGMTEIGWASQKVIDFQ